MGNRCNGDETAMCSYRALLDWVYGTAEWGADRMMHVSTCNFLGDSYNAMEFMVDDERFQANYKRIRQEFAAVTSREVLEVVRAIGFDEETIGPFLTGEVFEVHCTEKFLQNDNKMPVSLRTNLIVGGMSVTDTGWPLFHYLPTWRQLMEHQVSNYGGNPQLVAWDIACNLACERCPREYAEIVSASPLNRGQLPQHITKILKHFPDLGDFVCAVQEFPQQGTARYDELVKQLTERELQYLTPETKGASVGFIFAKGVRVEKFVHSPFGSDPIQILRHIGGIKPEAVDKKDKKSLGTTGLKTAVLDTSNGLRFVCTHCKEFKTEAGTKLLTRYLHAVAGDARDRCIVILCDANTPNDRMAHVFEEGLHECGFQVLTPAASIRTTRKQRSELHGQIYDQRKCLKVVEAHKTFAAIRPRASPDLDASPWEFSGSLQVYPDLRTTPWILPNRRWPTDHCMVMLDLHRRP